MGAVDADVVAARLRDGFAGPNRSGAEYGRILLGRVSYLDAFVEGRPFPPFEIEIQMSSKCNLHCRWCIGEEIQSKNHVLRLPNSITEENVAKLVSAIIEFRIGGLGVETVKFSGFIGEPLLNKRATLTAIRSLAGAGLRVGVFTNGVLMDESTWQTLVNVDYVHVSLDSGPSSYFWLKESPEGVYSRSTFDRVLRNIAGLDQTRRERAPGSKLRINVGYVVVPGNQDQLREATRLVRLAGADSIRFKCDIGARHDLHRAGLLDEVFREIEFAREECRGEGGFRVHTVHTREDIEARVYARWKADGGCFFQEFFTTVGSDGDVYLCDHNTMPGAIPLGNVINQSLEEIWTSGRRRYLADGVRYVCQSGVCPPFGNVANAILRDIRQLADSHGAPAVKGALDRLRAEGEGR